MERKEYLKQLKEKAHLSMSDRSPVNTVGRYKALGLPSITADYSLDLTTSVATIKSYRDNVKDSIPQWSVERIMELLPPCIDGYTLYHDYPHLYYSQKKMSASELALFYATGNNPFYFWQQIEDCLRFLFENCESDYKEYLEGYTNVHGNQRL